MKAKKHCPICGGFVGIKTKQAVLGTRPDSGRKLMGLVTIKHCGKCGWVSEWTCDTLLAYAEKEAADGRLVLAPALQMRKEQQA